MINDAGRKLFSFVNWRKHGSTVSVIISCSFDRQSIPITLPVHRPVSTSVSKGTHSTRLCTGCSCPFTHVDIDIQLVLCVQ